MRTTISTIVVCLLAVVMNSHSQTQSNSPVGSFGFQLSNTIGVLNFDGAGNVAVTYNSVDNGSLTSGTATGTYSGNSNGIGTMNLTANDGSGTLTIATVITDSGAGILLLQSGGGGGNNGGGNGGGNNGGNNNGSPTGIARRQ